MTFNFLLRLYDFGLCVCWTEYQENGCSLCLYPCCSLSNQHFGSSPETCCPNLVLTVPPVFSCSDGFACQRLFEWHTVAFVLPCRLLQGIPFFVFFLTKMKNVLIRGRNSTESVSVFCFLLGPTSIFTLTEQALKTLRVCSYFCLSH